jgi:hypothetical protein
VLSERVVEFEEEEDEGACYAFAQDGGASTIFVIGQEFYDDDDFPNSDFAIVEILGGSGRPVDVLVTKRGRKLTPERVVAAASRISSSCRSISRSSRHRSTGSSPPCGHGPDAPPTTHPTLLVECQQEPMISP